MTLAHCLPPVLPITNHHNTDTLPTTCPTNHLPPQHWHTAETYPTNHLLPWHLHTAYHLSYQSHTTTTLAHCLLPVLPITNQHNTSTLSTTCPTNHLPPWHWYSTCKCSCSCICWFSSRCRKQFYMVLLNANFNTFKEHRTLPLG